MPEEQPDSEQALTCSPAVPRYLDETFLSPHPATLLWWQQRAKCESCCHKIINANGSNPSMLCGAVPFNRFKSKGKDYGQPYCIDVRLSGSPCGPSAALWKLRQA